jgi:hypothetical protein
MKKTLLTVICFYVTSLFSQSENEILFLPEDPGIEFTELYYTGKKVKLTKPIVGEGNHGSSKIIEHISGFRGEQNSEIHDGIYINTEQEYFYTGNGFQFMPRKITVLIFHKGNGFISTWTPYIREETYLDNNRKSRRVFSGIAEHNAELYQIVREPEVGSRTLQRMADSEVPSVTRRGMGELRSSFRLSPENIRVTEQGELFKSPNQNQGEHGEIKFTKIITGVDDEAIMYALGTVWNNMIDLDIKAGEYISEKAKRMAEQGEILRQNIIRKNRNNAIIIRQR